MKVLQKRLLVKRRLALDQLAVHPFQDRFVAEGEGVVQRLLDREVGVAAGRIDIRDRMAGRAGDASPCQGILADVVVGVVEPVALESPGEKRHRVARTENRYAGLLNELKRWALWSHFS